MNCKSVPDPPKLHYRTTRGPPPGEGKEKTKKVPLIIFSDYLLKGNTTANVYEAAVIHASGVFPIVYDQVIAWDVKQSLWVIHHKK
jgi:hypothetical protein